MELMHPTASRLAASEPQGPVYFDANPLSDHHLTGIGRYAARLALAMKSIREVRFFRANQELIAPADLDWTQDQDLNKWARHLKMGTLGPLSPTPRGSVGIWPLLRPLEHYFDHEVSIIHDLTPLILPHTHRESIRPDFQGFCGKAIGSSDIAIAVSESTKADAEWLVNFDADRIHVAPSGPSLCIEAHAHTKQVVRERNVGLVVSTLEPRKNPEFLCDWFHSTPCLSNDAELWWVGSIGWITSRDDLKAFETRPGTNRRIKFLGVVDDAQLCRLYQTASYTMYPSLYEGFGFPVLDSLRHGTPVLTAFHSSIREFRSPGIYFFDPADNSTLDDAYQQFVGEASTLTIPPEPLDRDYSWRNVAGILLRACGTEVRQSPRNTAAA